MVDINKNIEYTKEEIALNKLFSEDLIYTKLIKELGNLKIFYSKENSSAHLKLNKITNKLRIRRKELLKNV